MPDVKDTKAAEREWFPPQYVHILSLPTIYLDEMRRFRRTVLVSAVAVSVLLAWIAIECRRRVDATNALSGIIQTSTEATWQAQSQESRPASSPTRGR